MAYPLWSRSGCVESCGTTHWFSLEAVLLLLARCVNGNDGGKVLGLSPSCVGSISASALALALISCARILINSSSGVLALAIELFRELLDWPLPPQNGGG